MQAKGPVPGRGRKRVESTTCICPYDDYTQLTLSGYGKTSDPTLCTLLTDTVYLRIRRYDVGRADWPRPKHIISGPLHALLQTVHVGTNLHDRCEQRERATPEEEAAAGGTSVWTCVLVRPWRPSARKSRAVR